jgi:predicted DNA-binding transcriptional regulator YafY
MKKMRKTNRPQSYRVKRILELIRSGTRTGELPSTRQLGRELEVNRNTILADLDVLRDDENAPVQYDPGRHGYMLTDPTWELPAIQISRQELFAFSVADKVIGAFRGTPLETDMRSVMGKIQSQLEGKITIDPSSFTENISVLSEDYAQLDPQIWAATARSIDRQEQVCAAYTKFDGTRGSYTIDPYHLVAYHGDWYLVGFHHRRGKIASFALSRVSDVTWTGETFEVPEEFDPASWLREAFGITGGEKPFRVRLLFGAAVAAYIRRRRWHPTQEMIDRKNGSVELQMETTGWKELVRLILSWQPDVKVLAPKRLRDRVEEKMRMALEGDHRS